MEYIGLYAIYNSFNYKVVNSPNLCNFIISVIDLTEDTQKKKKILENIKLHMGLSQFEEIRTYVNRKYNNDSEIRNLFANC